LRDAILERAGAAAGDDLQWRWHSERGTLEFAATRAGG